MVDFDDNFFDRADAHIKLSNKQLSESTVGKVSASMMYGTARFNAWLSATGWATKQEMQAARDETLEYFVDEYRKMLAENIDDYIQKFDSYVPTRK